MIYDEGRVVARDDIEAIKWYRRAAELGDNDALNNLGMMYREGRAKPKDNDEAQRWLIKSMGTPFFGRT